MMRICAWCKNIIEPNKTGETHPVSHGICHDCFILFEYKKVPLDSLLQSLQLPVFIVDNNVTVEGANSPALNVLQKSQKTIQSQLGGNVLDCIYSSLPGGCGQTIHCSGCVIRNSVKKTFTTGEPIIKMESFNILKTSKGLVKMTILISTEKIGDRILLQIDNLKPVSDEDQISQIDI